METLLECVVNVSEGRDAGVVSELAAAGGPLVLDIHSDPDHNRSVLTLAGTIDALSEAVRALARRAVDLLDLGPHVGVHPRIGVLDVVPFVALAMSPRRSPLLLGEGPLPAAVRARDAFAAWAAAELALPCFLYGPERSLPELRRRAWTSLEPDFGPATPHPTAGAAAVGARTPLVAYNLWLSPGADLGLARRVAAGVRGPALRALGLAVGEGRRVQVSMNLVDPDRLGPGAAHDLVVAALREEVPRYEARREVEVEHAELVGLIPRAVLEAEPRARRSQLGLPESATIEARLEQAGLDGGRL